ncbi:BTAD domain-containing putative transcriptional regulator [Amycolatopsis sp. NPDC026612]|uniref:AfsR/SARP family transcriptional regulator n=1 Tax=Amycolatopsis sp. NPDC026612 TaxID=3155466 RepID=UPI0033E44CA9
MGAGGLVEIRVLGPLQLDQAGASVLPGGRRLRVVLSTLALNANRVTATDVLVDALWGTNPPSTARTQTQICISTLRKLLSDLDCRARVVTRSPGYLLQIDDDDLDYNRFEKLVGFALAHEAAGRLSEAVGDLRSALALWRGPALADVPSERVSRAALRMEESRVTAEVHRLRIELALGRHAEIIGDIHALLEENPAREELYEYLMLALYRSGRQFEALEVFRRARSVLLDSGGVEPGDRLRRLQLAILNRDKELLAPPEPVVAAQRRAEPAAGDYAGGLLPARSPGFTGREKALTQVTGLLAGPARPGSARIVGIWGPAGVGKSSLAIEAAHLLTAEFPHGCLYADLRDDGHPDQAVSRTLDRFLRALGVPASAVPDSLPDRIGSYRSTLAGKRVLVVVDNALAPDRIRPLLPVDGGSAALVTIPDRPAVLPGVRQLELTELGIAQSVALLARRIGAERVAGEQRAAEQLAEAVGGVPSQLIVAAARVAAKPHARIADAVRRLGERPEEGANLALTYEGLSDAARRLFRLLGVIEAGEFPRWVAEPLLDEQPDRADDVFEDLVVAGLLDAAGSPDRRVVRYRLHGPVRAYARELARTAEPAESREAAERRWLGACLARAEVAHRQEFGGDYAILHGAAPRWTPPPGTGTASELGITWLDEERALLVGAVRQAAAAGYDELCWDLALTLVTLFEARGYFDDWRDTTSVALDAVRRAANRRGEAAMAYSLGALNIARKRLADASAQLTTALELFDRERDVHGKGLVLRNLAFIDWVRGDLSAMRARYEQALLNMRSVGDRMGEALVLCNIAKFSGTEGNENYARELFQEALAISTDVSCRRGEAAALSGLADLYLRTDRLEDAGDMLNRALLIVQEDRDRVGEAVALYSLGLTRKRQGRPEHAEIVLMQALTAARQVGERQIEAQALYQLGELLLERGNVKGALDYCAEANRVLGGLGQDIWRPRSGALAVPQSLLT